MLALFQKNGRCFLGLLLRQLRKFPKLLFADLPYVAEEKDEG